MISSRLARIAAVSIALAPTAPLLWTITDEGTPLFTPGQADRGQGLERLAEDGNPASSRTTSSRT
jgi:hypothetical protein